MSSSHRHNHSDRSEQPAQPASKQLVDLLTTALHCRRDAVVELESDSRIVQFRRQILPPFTIGLTQHTLLKHASNEQAILSQDFAFDQGIQHLQTTLTAPAPDEQPPQEEILYVADDDLHLTATDRFVVRLTTEEFATDLSSQIAFYQ